MSTQLANKNTLLFIWFSNNLQTNPECVGTFSH